MDHISILNHCIEEKKKNSSVFDDVRMVSFLDQMEFDLTQDRSTLKGLKLSAFLLWSKREGMSSPWSLVHRFG